MNCLVILYRFDFVPLWFVENLLEKTRIVETASLIIITDLIMIAA